MRERVRETERERDRGRETDRERQIERETEGERQIEEGGRAYTQVVLTMAAASNHGFFVWILAFK